jgi:hypothetical protein
MKLISDTPYEDSCEDNEQELLGTNALREVYSRILNGEPREEDLMTYVMSSINYNLNMDVNTKRLELRLKEMESRLQSMEKKKTQIVESRLESMKEKFKTLDQHHMTMNEHVINTQLRMAALSGPVPTHDLLNAIDKRLGIVEQNLTQMEERNKCIGQGIQDCVPVEYETNSTNGALNKPTITELFNLVKELQRSSETSYARLLTEVSKVDQRLNNGSITTDKKNRNLSFNQDSSLASVLDGMEVRSTSIAKRDINTSFSSTRTGSRAKDLFAPVKICSNKNKNERLDFT